MKRKMLELKGKLGSTKEKVFRLIGDSGKEDSEVFSPTHSFTVAPSKATISPASYSLVTDVELKKALALMHLRISDLPK